MSGKSLFAVLALSAIGLAYEAQAADDPAPQKPAAEQPVKAETQPAKPAAEPREPTVKTLGIDDALLRTLEAKSDPDAADNQPPLQRVGQRMRDVEGRLGRTDVGDETRNIQTLIVQDLDKLIEMAKKGGG
jgi:hypothetical protein